MSVGIATTPPDAMKLAVVSTRCLRASGEIMGERNCVMLSLTGV